MQLQLKKITCLIVDDEPLAREVLKKHIQQISILEIAGECSNAVEALTFIQKTTVNLLFLDIQMPHILGTSFIRSLRNPPKVIFTTAFRKFAVEGFELNAVDYLVKPINFDRFLKAINKAFEIELPVSNSTAFYSSSITEPSRPFLYFRVDRKMIKVYIEEIQFIESLKDYVKIVTISKSIVTKQTIASLEEILPDRFFMRIHRSYIVAINKIASFNADLVEIGKIEIPIGRSFKHNVNRILNST